MTAHPWSRLGRIAIIIVISGVALVAGGEERVTDRLEIRGAVLKVSPDLQNVPPGLPTVVLIALGRLDRGQIPVGLGLNCRLGGDIFTNKRLQFGFGQMLLGPRRLDIVGNRCVQ